MKLLILFAVIATAAASCENGCSGHGHCGLYDICKCYGNWEGNDCSGRVCPYEKAWVDTAITTDDAHNYARCANKGECDGKSGQCKCWEPFEGKGCRRMACPNGCSGHGTCEYISELAASNTCDWDSSTYAANPDCAHSSIVGTTIDSVTYGAKHASTQVPSLWDAWKIQGCQCDPGYEGADCSSRICPSGDDPLRHLSGEGSDSVDQANHQFNVKINGGGADWVVKEGQDSGANAAHAQGMGPPTFVLAFTDTFNEQWFTRPIPLGVTGDCDDEKTCPLEDRRGWFTSNVDDQAVKKNQALILSHNIRQALLDLPNGAITGADVDPRTGEKDSYKLDVECTNAVTKICIGGDKVDDGTACTDDSIGGDCDTASTGKCVTNKYGYDCTIKMGSKHNSGDLSNKLECWTAGCAHVGASTTANPGGCSPKYMGLPAMSSCTVTDVVGTSNYDTCSGRGACNGADGLCECYEGFTDEDCHVQTVLV